MQKEVFNQRWEFLKMQLTDKFKDVSKGSASSETSTAYPGRNAAREPASAAYRQQFALNSYDTAGNPVASHLNMNTAGRHMR